MLKSCKKIIFTVSDKGTSIVAMVKKYLKVTSICDLFHMFLDASAALGAKVANKRINDREKIKKELNSYNDSLHNEHVIDYLKAESNKSDLHQEKYKNGLEDMTNKTHPYTLETSELQTTAKVTDTLRMVHGIFDEILNDSGFSDKGKKLDRFKRRIPDYSQVIDIWHKYTDDEMIKLNKTADELLFIKNLLLPVSYWKKTIKQTKNKKIKSNYSA